MELFPSKKFPCLLKRNFSLPVHGCVCLFSDVISALISLGYGRSVAENAVNEAMRKLGAITNVEVLVREALKYKT